MSDQISIHKQYRDEDKTVHVDVTIEQISNGWLMTRSMHKISDREEDGPMDYEPEAYETVKTYFKENPADKSTPLWELVEFDEE